MRLSSPSAPVAQYRAVGVLDGGAGSAWTDTIDLDNPGDFETDWTIDLDPGSSIENETANSLDLSDDASGTINLSDGSEISFENIERFDW